jgi:hypothetical protein
MDVCTTTILGDTASKRAEFEKSGSRLMSLNPLLDPRSSLKTL